MYSLDFIVYPSSCNEKGEMKLYDVMQRMQDCSELWLKSEPRYNQYYEENNRAQLLAYRQLDILRVPKYGENLRVTTSIYEMNSVFGHRNTNIYDATGQPCYLSWSMGAFVERATGHLSKVPQEVIDTLTYDDKTDMEYTDRRIFLPKDKQESCEEFKVMKNDIDYNHHMNNAHYMRMALEVLPENFHFNRVRIEYKVPARKGDIIIPKRIITGADAFIILYVGEHIGTIFQFCNVDR